MNKVIASNEYHEDPMADLQPFKSRVGPVKETRSDMSLATAAKAESDKPGKPSRTASAPGNGVPPSAGVLSDADIQKLQRRLVSGDGALARRADLGELNTRIVKMFETLNKGVGEMYVAKAEADRSVLSARIDNLEDAVNRMEGALRIEFEPVLRKSMAQVMEEQNAGRPRRGRYLWMALLFVASLGLGAFFHAPLTAGASGIGDFIEAQMTKTTKN